MSVSVDLYFLISHSVVLCCLCDLLPVCSAQVMMQKNYPELGLFNGSRGVVIGFESGTGYPVVQYLDRKHTAAPAEWTFPRGLNEPAATRTQIPLALAWVSTTVPYRYRYRSLLLLLLLLTDHCSLAIRSDSYADMNMNMIRS